MGVGKIANAVQAWQELERRHLERQDVKIPEKLRISILFKLIPTELCKDFISQATKWTSYTQSKDHLKQLQFCRTCGPSPMLMKLNEDEPQTLQGSSGSEDEASEIISEDGEILKLERRD